MTLLEHSDEFLYRVLVSRDARFDGRFFAAVRTTGVFCRSICPAPRPRPGNVRYFATAAAASEAGYRPCLRCRPEAAPGTPGWLGTEATVRRALREIAAGQFDRQGMDRFSALLGVGPRHLRRLFQQHVGISPRHLAVHRRVLFAKKLLDETSLSITQVAHAAGFGSIRRFNATFREVFHETPRRLREAARRSASGPRGSVTLRLAARPPLDFDHTLAFFRPRSIPGVEETGVAHFARTFRLGSIPGVLRVSREGATPALRLEVPIAEPGQLLDLVERVRRLFDLDADPLCIQQALERDPHLQSRVRLRPGLRVPGAFEPAELCLRAVLGQQIRVAAATTLAGRLAATYGRPCETPFPALTRLFPSTRELRGVDFAALGMPERRRRTLRNVVDALHDGILAEPCHTLERIVQRWCRVGGVGEWTAHYIALRAYQEPDAFPASDLGIRKALARGGVLPSPGDARRIAEAWRPWRGYATLHLWSTPPRQASDSPAIDAVTTGC